MLIAFSGVDCAGKSTQIQLLEQYFASQGKTCTVLWYRPGYSHEMQKSKDALRTAVGFLKSQAKKLHTAPFHRLNQPSAASQHVPNDAKPRPKVPAPMWLMAAFADTLWAWGIHLRYLMRKYDVVICDRYFEDARLDIIFKYPDIFWSESAFLPIKHGLPKPDLSILLWLPYETMLQRAEAKNEPFPDDPQTRLLRYRAYEFLADDNAIQLIDASGGIEETHQKIKSLITDI